MDIRPRLLVCVIALAAAFDSSAQSARTEWYVSPSGSGDACSDAQPCSLSSAQQQVRVATAAMQSDVVVRLKGGVYRLDAPFSLTAADSGTKNHFVVYEANGTEQPVLSGGRVISGWTVADASSNIWKAEVGKLETRQLFVNGVRARRSSRAQGVPGKVTRTSEGFLTNSALPLKWQSPGDVELVWLGQSGGIFGWAEARCRVKGASANKAGALIAVVQPCFERAVRLYGTTILDGLNFYQLGTPTWVENDASFLQDAGQSERWALQRSGEANTLYYRAPVGENPNAANIVAATTQGLVEVGNDSTPAHHIVLRGLTFAESTWLGPDSGEGYPTVFANNYTQNGRMSPSGSTATITRYTDKTADFAYPPGAVDLHNVQDVRVEDCRFERLGSIGLRVGEGAKRVSIIGNVFRDISAGAILLGSTGSTPEGAAEDNVISNNVIEAIGVEYTTSPGIFLATPIRTTVSHNYVSDTAYTGIVITGTLDEVGHTAGNRIVSNLIEGVLQRGTDGGGIYSVFGQGPALDNGLLIERNVTRNARERKGFHVAVGLYTDMLSTYVTLRKNVAYGFVASTGGYNWPYVDTIINRENYYDTAAQWYHKNPLRNSVFEGNVTLAPANPAAACAAIPECATIVKEAGLQPAYWSRRQGIYRFGEFPLTEEPEQSKLTSFPLTGVRSGVDFGRGKWLVRNEQKGYASRGFGYFSGAAGPRMLELSPGLTLSSVTLEGKGEYSLSDGVNPTRQGKLSGVGTPLKVETGWMQPGARVTIALTGQSAVAVDNIETRARVSE